MAMISAACSDDDDDTASGDDGSASDDGSSGDDGSASDDGSSGDDGSASDDGSSGDDGSAGPATGEPIKFGNVSTITHPAISAQDIVDATEAWFEYINEELGGIDGRPLELLVCDDQGDAALAIQCANNQLEEGIVGFAGQWSLAFGANALAIVEQEGVPIIGGLPITQQENQSPIEFPTTPGAAGRYPAIALSLLGEEAGNLSAILNDSPASQLTSQQVVDICEDVGCPSYNVTYFDSAAADYTPAASNAVSGDTNGVILGMTSDQAGRMLEALQNVGYDGEIAATGLIASPEVFEQANDMLIGSVLLFTGIYTGRESLSGTYAEQYDLYERVLTDAGVPLSDQTVNGVSGAQYLYEVLLTIDGEITATSLLEALNANTDWPGFLTHPMSDDFAPEGLPAIRNPFFTAFEYVGDGQLASADVSGVDDVYKSEVNGFGFISGFVPGGGS